MGPFARIGKEPIVHTLQIVVDFLSPVGSILRAKRVETEVTGSLGVARTIVDEKGFVGQNLLGGQHMAEECGIGLHGFHLIALVGGIEIEGNGMAIAVEVGTLGPRHHEGIGVGKHNDAITFLAKAKQQPEIALGHSTTIAHPGMATLVERNTSPHQRGQLLLELIGRDAASLQVAKDATLSVGVKSLGCIVKAQCFKTADGLRLVERDDDAPEIENNVLYHRVCV